MTVVIKIGNRAMDRAMGNDALSNLELATSQEPSVIVHGGGDTVTSVAERLGIEQKFVTSPEGFRSRYTDLETMEVFIMVMAGKINKEIVRKLWSRKIPALGLTGLDGGLMRAERKKRLIVMDERKRKQVIQGGYTGRITDVDARLLQTLLWAGYVPVIAPIGLGQESELLNLDGDRSAAHIAGALKANALLLLTDVEGVTIRGTLVRRFTTVEAKRILPELGPGMITKVYAALEALSMGVNKVVIAPSNTTKPFTSALNGDTGTEIVP